MWAGPHRARRYTGVQLLTEAAGTPGYSSPGRGEIAGTAIGPFLSVWASHFPSDLAGNEIETETLGWKSWLAFQRDPHKIHDSKFFFSSPLAQEQKYEDRSVGSVVVEVFL